MIILMPLRSSIRDPSTNPPKPMFQLSGFYYRVLGFVGKWGLRVPSSALGLGFRVAGGSLQISLGFEWGRRVYGIRVKGLGFRVKGLGY